MKSIPHLELLIPWSTTKFREEPIFYNLRYSDITGLLKSIADERIPKLGSELECSIFQKLYATGGKMSDLTQAGSSALLVFHRTPGYWVRMMDFFPFFESPTADRSIHHIRELRLNNLSKAKIVGATVSSSLYFWWLFSIGNCRNLTFNDVYEFPVSQPTDAISKSLESRFDQLMADLRANATIQNRGDTRFEEFNWGRSKPIVDEIDSTLRDHYLFSPEELDFIINYDIKIRMGLNGGVAEDRGEEVD